jgi:hypothetical protein
MYVSEECTCLLLVDFCSERFSTLKMASTKTSDQLLVWLGQLEMWHLKTHLSSGWFGWVS